MLNLIRPLSALTIVLTLGRGLLPGRRALALLLVLLLFTQASVPPSSAFPNASSPGATTAPPRHASRSTAGGPARPAASTPASETFGIVLTALSVAFDGHAGIDYHQQSRSVVVSANSPTGQPHNFELIDGGGARRPFSNVSGLGGALKLATARDDGRGASLGGFRTGELFAGTGAAGVVARVSPDGAAVQNPWVTLPGEAGPPAGLHVDRTGVFGGDLVVVTEAGGVWRINSSGVAAQVATLNTPLSGVTTVPDDAARYGPWAGKILAGAKEQGGVYAVDAQGGADSYRLGVSPEDISVVPAHENFFGLDPADGKLWGAPADAFAGVIGDVLVAQGSPGVLARVRWNGTEFETGQVAQVARWGQITFAPAGVAELRVVRQVYDRLAVVRRAPALDSGRVEGALWQLSAENVTLDGTDVITSDLLVPGTPSVAVGQGRQSFGGVVEGGEDSQPTGYAVSIGGNASLRHLITRTNPFEMEAVATPPAPAGARDVSVTKAGQPVGDYSTLRNLSLSGQAGAVAVPPGTYGSFSAAGRTALVLGAENGSEPAVYNLQGLTLNGGSELRLVGPVALTVRGDVSLTGSTAGAADNPRRLLLKVAEGGVKVGGGAVLYGVVRAPRGAVEVAGRGRLRGTVMCDSLNVGGNGVLQVTENDVPPPPVNRPPAVEAGPDLTTTLPADTVSLNGTAGDDGLPRGGTLSVNWNASSGPGPVTFGSPDRAATTAAFVEPGVYVLKLTASDGRLTRSDSVRVEVVARNQPPAVNAGPDQTVRLPNSAALAGTVADDALPRGSILSLNWSVSSGPGAATFGKPHDAATTATFAAPGVYTLKLSADDSEFDISDELVVNVLAANQPPTADAGPDRTITLSESAGLSGAVADDAAPGFPLAVTWEKVSGPGSVTFNDPHQAATSATFAEPGDYILRLTAGDTEFSSRDEVAVVVRPGASGRVFTLDADFDKGSSINVTHGTPDQLQLDETARSFNFIWVAVSTKGTVVKIDTETGAVLGEYFTSPAGQPRNPSRTTVDHNGNVWASNRNGNSVLRIGLLENGQCVDRDGNGRIDTSTGYGDVRPWTNAGGADTNGGVSTARDECVVNYTKVNSFGTRHVSVTKDNDVWVSGTGGQRFDLIDGKTGLVKRSEPSVGYGGYGGLIDKFGVIWSARPLLRWDTANPLTGPSGGNWRGYGHDSYGLCIDSKGNVWNTSFSPQIHKFAPDGTHLGTFNHGSGAAQGCVVDKNDDVWVAHSLYLSTVGHLKNTGVFVGNVTVGPGPTGVAVDAKGKVWAAMYGGQSVARIDPTLGPVGADGVTPVGAVDLTTRNLGGDLYNYSDMTGSTLSGAPGQGTWSAVFDSEKAGAGWGRVAWAAKVCGDGLLTVSVSTGEDGTNFSQPVVVSNGDDPEVPAGRYARVSVKFERASSGESPVLYDLSIGTTGFEVETPANTAPDVDAGPDRTLEGVSKTTLRGAACDDGLPSNRKLALAWSKVSGPGAVAFASPNSPTTEVTFAVPGIYELKLTAGDSAFDGSDTVVVEVLPGNEPPAVNAGPDRSIVHPAAAALAGTVEDDGLPRGSTLLVTWSKVSGPGGVTFSDPNAASTAARFGAPGTYVLRLTASDTESAARDEVTLTVGGENQPPAVHAGPDRDITLPNNTTLEGTATDDGWPEGNTLAVTWSKVSGPGAVTFNNPNQAATSASFGEPGVYVLRLSASDSQLSASDEVTVTANPAVPPPAVSITGLPDGAEVTTRVNVLGTVSAGSDWRLEYTLGDDGASARWTTLASGNTPVVGGLLGVFDPTLLLNGTYTLRLVATDAAAQTGAAAVSFIVSGQQKVGNFSLSFSDLNVPVAGLPIEVTRTYDSRDKRTGDFGVGWTLGLGNLRVEKSGILGADWEQTRGGGFLPTYCLQPRRPRFVTITFPSGKVYKFRTVTSPQCSVLVPVESAAVGFAPLPGTQGSLTALAENDILVFGDSPGAVELRDFNNLELYNPTRFRLTTEDGTVLIVDQTTGLRSMTDRNGNTLTVNADGITHSSGKSILFTRDGQGRITRITDPAGNAMTYSYDAGGDLVGFTNRENHTSHFTYDSTHGLLGVTDPRGVQPLRNEYDDDGRLVRHTDAFGKVINYERDLSTRQEVVTDRLGNVQVMEYDERGQVVRVTSPGGGVVTFAYDARDNLLTQTNRDGRVTSYTYDAQDRRTSETDPLGNTTRYTYNGRGQVLTVTDPQGRVTTNTYDASGNLTATADAAGNTSRSTYDSRGLMTGHTDPLGNSVSYEYDSFGNLTKTTDPLGNVATKTYDANGKTLSESETRTAGGVAHTVTTGYEYDRLNRLTRITYADGSTAQSVYDAGGRLAASVDTFGGRTTYEYDEMGRQTRTSYPDGTKEESIYDAEGRRVKAIANTGHATTYAYDALGRVVKTTYSTGASAVAAYDNNDNVISLTDPRGQVSRYEYDAERRMTKAVNALGEVTTFTYDASGNQTSRTNPGGQTMRYEYDAENQLTRVIYPDSTTQATVYDAGGRVASRTDQAGHTTLYEHDANGRLVKVTDPLGGASRYTYDEGGQLLRQTDANNHTTSYEYDLMGRRVKRTLPLGMSETSSYDASGRLVSRTDFRGKTTAYAYDSSNRIASITPEASFGEVPVTFTYTATGRRATMTDATGTTRYAYNEYDKLLAKQTPHGTLSYTYDAAGSLLSLRSSNPNGVSVNYSYDALGRLANATDNNLPAGANATAYAYDANGNLAGSLYPNGARTAYTFNATNRLTGVNATRSGTTLASYAYTLGPAGNRLSDTDHTGRTAVYTYDALFRLTRESVGGDPATDGAVSYTYDAVGNRLTRTSDMPGIASSAAAYDANDRPGGNQYDENGNAVGANSHVYAFNSENRMTGVDGGAVRFVYDGDGNRVARTAGGVTTYFLVDTNNFTGHAQVVEELQGGGVTRQYTYGLDLISQRQLLGGSWQTTFYGYDGHGSVRYLTDAAGAVTDTYTYDAFGSLTARTGTTPNDYLYAGEQFDAGVGLYYLRARHYDASSGRFTSMDTYGGRLSDPPSLHKYSYVQNNAPNLIDPSGHMSLNEQLTVSATVGVFATIGAVVTGYFVYDVLVDAKRRGNILHRHIYPYYGRRGFLTNRWIGTNANPPRNPLRPDARHHGSNSAFRIHAGEVYEFKPHTEVEEGRRQVEYYIKVLKGHYQNVNWHKGKFLLTPKLIKVQEFPYIRFRLDLPERGVLTYEPIPDWEAATKAGAAAAMFTFMLLRNIPDPSPTENAPAGDSPPDIISEPEMPSQNPIEVIPEPIGDPVPYI